MDAENTRRYVFRYRGIEIGDNAISLVCTDGEQAFTITDSVGGLNLAELLNLVDDHNSTYHANPGH